MIKRTYSVAYLVRPNKKTNGTPCVINLTFTGKLKGNIKNEAKLVRTLCRIHRVNPDAITINAARLTKTYIPLITPLIEKIAGLFARRQEQQ